MKSMIAAATALLVISAAAAPALPVPSPTPTSVFGSPTPSIQPTPSQEPIFTPTTTPTTTAATPTASPVPTLTPLVTPTPFVTFSPIPTLTPLFTATPSLTPVGSPTPTGVTTTATPTPTVSPSPSPLPPAGAQSFSFAFTNDGWTFANPAPFAVVGGTYNGVDGSLEMTTSDNTNSFAFWESPITSLVNGTTGPTSLYRTTFTVRGDQADLTRVPAIRMRSSSLSFEQSDALLISSTELGNVSPPMGGRNYYQFFSQPAGVSQFRLDLDVLNFDPSDAANARISLDNVVVEALALPNEAFGQTVGSFDFVANGSLGFTQRNAFPILTSPQEFSQTNGLLIRGTLIPNTANGNIFGYWGAETAINVLGNTFYSLTFRARSTATAATKAQVPTFRFRINDSSLKTSAILNIDSRDGISRVPVDGVQEAYTMYFMAPPEIANNSLIISFDYLYAHNTGDDANIAVMLDSIIIRQYVVTGF